MEIKCLFETRGASLCRENAFRLTKLSDCGSNIDDQTKRSHLNQHIGFVQEHELITVRVLRVNRPLGNPEHEFRCDAASTEVRLGQEPLIVCVFMS